MNKLATPIVLFVAPIPLIACLDATPGVARRCMQLPRCMHDIGCTAPRDVHRMTPFSQFVTMDRLGLQGGYLKSDPSSTRSTTL